MHLLLCPGVSQITAMYIEGHLKGGFQTVKAYAGFCAFFKNWLDAKSTKLWPQRQGDLVAQDYRECLEYVNNEVCSPSQSDLGPVGTA